MSTIPEIVVSPREKNGTGEARRLRREEGMIPSVVYGLDAEPRSIAVAPKLINKILHSEKGLNTVVNLRLKDSEKTGYVMIKAMDRHPITDRLLHVDFLRVDMERPVHAVIPVEVSGEAPGVKMGGVLNIVRHELQITCLPKHLPGAFKIDVSGLGLDEAIRIKDLPQLEGVSYDLGPNRVVVVVHHEHTAVVDEDEAEEA